MQALTHYPTVLKWMDENLAWTTQLGKAFLNQQEEVLGSIQRLRKDASNVGNLKSTPQQELVNDSGDIEILPANDDTMYPPDYQDNAVYYEAGCALGFGAGFPIGPWLRRDFDWHHRQLVFWDNNHTRPHDWWREPIARRDAELASGVTVWQPEKPAPVAVVASVGRDLWNREAQVNRALPGKYFPPEVPVRQPTPAPDVDPRRDRTARSEQAEVGDAGEASAGKSKVQGPRSKVQSPGPVLEYVDARYANKAGDQAGDPV